MAYAGVAGHNAIVPGAFGCGYAEHTVARQMLAKVIEYMSAVGETMYNCTDDVGTTKAAVWQNAVNNTNKAIGSNGLAVSIHLNAADGSATGTEVLHYNSSELAAKVSAKIAGILGVRDRGPKDGKPIGYINSTKAESILIELCFIDNPSDMQKLMSKFDAVAKGIVEVLTGKVVVNSLTETSNEWTNKNNPCDGSYGTIEAVGGGVNTYTSPYNDGKYVQTIQPGTPYRVYGEKDGYYAIGGNQWVNKKYVKFAQYIAVVTPVGGVNTYTLDGQYIKTVSPNSEWIVLAESNGRYAIGVNEWIDGKYVMIK